MTTLAAESSSELASNQTWLKLVALYGVGPLIAVILTLWLTHTVSAKQDAQIAEAQAAKTEAQAARSAIENHAHDTHEQLDRIGRQLEANCRVQVLLAKNKSVEPLCEVGR
jgi:type VI protein secretion system component VasK